MLKKKWEDEEGEEDSEVSVQEINPSDFLINDGYKIHMKGIKVHERELKRVFKKKKMADKKEEEKYSFKPKLNKKSIQIVQSKSQLSTTPREVELFNMVQFRKQKKTELKDKWDRKKYQECTFSPRINQISDKIVSFKRGDNLKNNTIHESLFNEHKDRKNRKAKLEESTLKKTCTFKPNTSLSKNFKSPVTSSKDFLSRNMDFRKNKELRRKRRM